MSRLRWTVLAAVAACSGPAHPIHMEREVIEMRGEVRYRATAVGGDVVILAQHALGDRAAAGDAVLRHTTLALAEASPHHQLAGARAWLALSEAAHGAEAYDAAQRGVEELGRDADVFRGFDGMSLELLAKSNLERDPDGAAGTLRKVLATRIAYYVRHYAGAVE